MEKWQVEYGKAKDAFEKALKIVRLFGEKDSERFTFHEDYLEAIDFKGKKYRFEYDQIWRPCVCYKMNKSQPKDRIEVVSHVNSRDGIGIEVYRDDELILEIFRDDTSKRRELTLYKKDVDLRLVEDSIEVFRKRIPETFLE